MTKDDEHELIVYTMSLTMASEEHPYLVCEKEEEEGGEEEEEGEVMLQDNNFAVIILMSCLQLVTFWKVVKYRSIHFSRHLLLVFVLVIKPVTPKQVIRESSSSTTLKQGACMNKRLYKEETSDSVETTLAWL